MHSIVSTKAYVLRVVPDDEQSLRVLFATEELGVLPVSVQSGRSLESKHRPNLFVGAHVFIDMVRGYKGWILTGIKEESDISGCTPFGLYVGRIGLWVLQYLGVETVQTSEIYDMCDMVFSIIHSLGDTEKKHRENLSLWILESVLSTGGYREAPSSWDQTLLNERPETLSIRKSVVASVIDASHLGKKKYKLSSF